MGFWQEQTVPELSNSLLLQDLTQVRPEDVGYDHTAPFSTGSSRPMSGVESGVNVSTLDTKVDDPLFNMLMTLQEAANTQPGHL